MNDEEFFPRYYDLEEVVDQQLAPYIKSIIAICDEHDLPVVIGVQYSSSEESDKLCVASVLPKERTGKQIKNGTTALLKV